MALKFGQGLFLFRPNTVYKMEEQKNQQQECENSRFYKSVLVQQYFMFLENEGNGFS